MRFFKEFRINDLQIKQNLLKWAGSQDTCLVLDSNGSKQLFTDKYSGFDFLVAAGTVEEITHAVSADKNGFEELKQFHQRTNDWLFGYFQYDLKNEIEDLTSENSDRLDFPLMNFFQPRYVLGIQKDVLKIHYLNEYDNEDSVGRLFEQINSNESTKPADHAISAYLDWSGIQSKTTKEEYISAVLKILKHIQKGDVYELNYCIEFFAENVIVDAIKVYQALNERSPMPFSCYYKNNHLHLACASPERFLARRGDKIISQPMKGTAPRGRTHEADLALKQQLKTSAKERSENIMIVDLVRNDLSKTAARNSVVVEELCGIYTFRQLHQMISTVVSTMGSSLHWTDVIKNAFPMGSMTGAPKVRAMQLIEKYETTKRGLYSGAVGYVTPSGDFDFNVVIRSILYNEQNNYLSFMVGSAITADSKPESEYKECLLKARAMQETLEEFGREVSGANGMATIRQLSGT